MAGGRVTPDYDFFGTPVPPQAAAGPHGHAMPPGQAAPHVTAPRPASVPFDGPRNQFGTPVAGYSAPGHSAPGYSAPGYPAPAWGAGHHVPASGSISGGSVRVPSWVWRVAISVLVMVVLGALGVGRFAGLFESDLEVPQTLDGLPLDTSDTTGAHLSETFDGALALGGIDESDQAAGLYEDGTRAALLVVVRQELPRADAERDLSSLGPVTDVGAGTLCAALPEGAGTACLRSGEDLTVMVLMIGVSDPFEVARVTSLAWSGY